jgi:hypothetical protein
LLRYINSLFDFRRASNGSRHLNPSQFRQFDRFFHDRLVPYQRHIPDRFGHTKFHLPQQGNQRLGIVL